ncbi:MAG: hypothetical protein WCO11_03385 [Sphingomonadales bacterium]|jgi:hypothetical protein
MRLSLAIILAVGITAAVASGRARAGELVRLPDAARDAVIEAAARGPEKPAVFTPEQAQRDSLLSRSLYPEFYGRAGPGGMPVRDGKVHGEMTMFAGSGGTAGFAGTAIIPVGQNSTAMVSVMQGTSRYGNTQGFAFGFSTGSSGNGMSGSLGYGNSPFGYGYGGYGYGGYGLGILGGYGPSMPGFGRFGRRHW